LLDHSNHVYGVAQLPAAHVACGTCTVREEGGSDWVVFYLPMGALGRAYLVGGYPFSPGNESWQGPLDRWLAALGEAVYARFAFALGLIGHETSGDYHAADFERAEVPDRRWVGILLPRAGRRPYFPRTIADGSSP
jgi:hypothetical protein